MMTKRTNSSSSLITTQKVRHCAPLGTPIQELADNKPIFSNHRVYNLRNILVSTNFKEPASESRVLAPHSEFINKCRTSNCTYCPKLNKTGLIKSNSTGRTYYCKSNITCKSSDSIYCISCKTCGKHYVGQMGNTLMTFTLQP